MRRKDADHVEIVVADEGVGFDPAQRRLDADQTGGFGLFSIRERVEVAGGQVVIDSHPRRGTRITLTATLHANTVSAERLKR